MVQHTYIYALISHSEDKIHPKRAISSCVQCRIDLTTSFPKVLTYSQSHTGSRATKMSGHSA